MSGNYYAELASDLRSVADAIATLADREPSVGRLAYAVVTLCAGVLPDQHEQAAPIVDAIAATLGTQSGRSKNAPDQYEAVSMYGPLRVRAYALVPMPEDTEADQLRAENERLRAQREVTRRSEL